MSLTLSTTFSCAHFYRRKELTDTQNRKTFGKCFSEYGHGHDYILSATVLDSKMEQKLHMCLAALKEKLDHEHLNFRIQEFKDLVPTTENLALFCWNDLKKNRIKVKSLQLKENSDLWVEINA